MPHTFVIFGASGDLTRRKLVPALFSLHAKGRLPQPTRIVGFSRTAYSDDQWRAQLALSTAEFIGAEWDRQKWEEFASTISYLPGDIGKLEDFQRLSAVLDACEAGRQCTRVYYLATAPRFYQPAIGHLGQAGLARETDGPRRVVIEKPFGTDLATARELNQFVHTVFDERQVFRIDHYLGKETVQNLLVLRFANTIFEPIWNRNYIDHVQITVAEEVKVGSRGGYYDTADVLRDMFQNHLLQLMTITAMETPVRFEADLVRDEKAKVLQAVRPLDAAQMIDRTVRGQYAGYLDEPDVAADSQTATFAAVHLSVDNWRWQGVPFYLRSGKAMSCRTTQIVVQFREPPHMLFANAPPGANRLVIQVQPAEGIQLHFQTKVPDSEMKLRMTDLDFRFSRAFGGQLPDAYQPLLLDALEGDASLFARSDEVELAWGIVDPILDAWRHGNQPPLAVYEPGLWGPAESNAWMHRQGRTWFDACPVLG
ncbi:MAG: glucose-6-phosphate dehydrogenase [Planctomycetales bacterium]|nr:glucose-6-phosphate dehydrogenase [Planctomycetales bacterium]